MAKQTIGVGAAPNDGTGDTLRDALVKVNANTTELYDAVDAAIDADVVFDGRVVALETAPPAHTHPTSAITGLDTALAAKAPLASPALTGTPTAPTAAPGTDTTQLATTAFVKAAVTAGGGGGGGAVSSVFTRTGAVVAASGDYTVSQVTGAAPLASPALTGAPTAPTATAGDNSTKLATTAYVDTAVAAVDGGGPLTVTTQTGTTYIYALADADTLVRHNNAGAITATIPPNSSVAFPVGTTIALVQAGAGAVTLTPGVGVTLKVAATHTLVTGGTDALVHLVQTAANVWTVAGNLVETPATGTIAVSFQFGDGVTADAAGAIRTVRAPVGLTPIGWIADANASCTATFTIEKSAAGAESWSSLVGAGTAPAITAATHAADTDGAVDWTGGNVAQYGGVRVTLATYTPGTSKRVSLTLLFART